MGFLNFRLALMAKIESSKGEVKRSNALGEIKQNPELADGLTGSNGKTCI